MHEQPPVVDQFETEQQASFLEHLGDIELEAFGQRGTASQLLDMCPVPASQRSPAATETFLARLAEKNGIAIPEQFAHLRQEPKAPKPADEREVQPARTPEPKPMKTVLPDSEKPATIRSAEPIAMPVVEHQPIVQALPLLEQHVTATRAEAEAVDQQIVTPEPSAAIAVEQVLSAPLETLAPAIIEELTVHPIRLEANREVVTEKSEGTEQREPITPEAQLGALYEVVAAEVYESQMAVTDAEIADFLELEGREVAFETLEGGEALELPAIAEAEVVGESVILSVLSMEHEAVHEATVPEVVKALPLSVAKVISEVQQTLTIEELAPVNELLLEMAPIVERLQTLVTSERGVSEEAQQIEVVLEQYYEELCVLLNLPVSEEERMKFIARSKGEQAPETTATSFDASFDHGMREIKHDASGNDHTIPVLVQQTANLVRFILQTHGLATTDAH